ncbi:MAG: hypothetical protein K8W52_02175 [Deltaproteobacteria bacterium]|nr:hypothetical protein [Deltaproteobacteria bacterium]
MRRRNTTAALLVLALARATPAAADAPPEPDPAPVEPAIPPADAPAEPPAPAAAPAPAPADEQNLLAHINDAPDTDTPDTDAPKDAPDTFGKQLRFFGIETNWSGYGDLKFSMVPNQKDASFDASHFNPILSVRMSDDLSGELELEFEHGGAGINIEYAMVDWLPLGSRALVIRTGKFLVPFGRFNESLHPSFRWAQIDRPLMMSEVVPVEWSDVGVQLRGELARGDVTLAYAAYVANGLDEHPGAAAETDEGALGFIGGLRSNLADSNWDKALGARAEIRIGRGEARTASLGVSGYTGRTSPTGDPDGPERLTLADVDVTARVGSLVINAEVAQALFGSQRHGYFQRFERGAYVQLGYILGRTTLVGRYDYARLGAQDGGVVGPLTAAHQGVATIKYAPAPSWSVRAELAEPLTRGADRADTRISAALTFVF